MSAAAEKNTKAPSDRKRQPTNRRRRPSGGKAKAPASEATPKPAPEAPRETTPRPPRPPSTPVPENLLGKKSTGTVSSVIRRGKYNFGFISIGQGENAPLIYYNPSGYSDAKLYLRRDFEVEFTVDKDETGRFLAKDIKLTAAGEKLKAERDAEYEAKKAARAAAAASAPAAAPAAAAPESKKDDKKERRRKPRREAPQGTPLTLRVTCQGKSEEKSVEVHNLISIGKLKGLAIKAIGAEGEFNVYHVPNNGGDMVFLSREVLSSLNNNDKIHLAEPKKETA